MKILAYYYQYLKMVEYNSHKKINIYPSLNDQQFRLNKTNEVGDYFAGEVKER